MTTHKFKLHLLLHSATIVEDELRRRLAKIDVHPRQARTLDALARMEAASQVRLSQEFGVAPSSMSTMTARLIDAGFVTREIDPNEARAHILRLTDRGRGLLADIHAVWRDVDALIEKRLGAEDAAQLADLTRALRDSFGGHAPGTPPPETPSRPETDR